jgi:hypothetical protein
MVELGELGYFNIGCAAVTFASSLLPADDSFDDGVNVDIRAFTGIAEDILTMLDGMLDAPAVMFSHSEEIIYLIKQYIATHRSSIGKDSQNELFDFSRVDSLDVSRQYKEFRDAVAGRAMRPPRERKEYFDVTVFAHLKNHPTEYARVSADLTTAIIGWCERHVTVM